MKIGIFSEAYTPYISGLVTSEVMLKKALEAQGHEVYVVTANLESFKYEYDEKERILRIPGIPTGIYDSRFTSIYPVRAVNKIKSWKLDVIHSQTEFAIGTFAISVTKGVNTDINNYLFGSILSLNETDIIISIILSIVVILLYIISYNKIFAITFDEKFAKSIGINTNLYNIIFATLCSIVVVLGMRLMGSLLISSIIIFPTLSSMQYFKKFKSVVISSVIISILTFIIGLIISYLYATPTGATIVIVNLIIFIIFKIISIIKAKKYWK